MLVGESSLETKNKVVGLKQTLRAIQQDKTCVVYLANDVDEHIVKKIKLASHGKNVKIVITRVGRKELGQICRIDVSAAVVALVQE
ncbi:MAG TPA: 50S ribosomal protein L7ae-like protein [Firmicutes bacterium]|nr:50S ribosomal protein L7ae-like protein [Bacillota bacterium]HBT16099.1 50S ribosomal protein L7ae-like protein [Bacillota bacterium]